jgi:hypothetical protein
MELLSWKTPLENYFITSLGNKNISVLATCTLTKRQQAQTTLVGLYHVHTSV